MDLSLFCQNNLLYTQESLWRYRPRGYHPVNLGDTFKDGRYKIHHKLGWDGFSTVWLVKDKVSVINLSIHFFSCQLLASQNQWVLLKIMTADSPASRELQSIKHLEKHSQCILSSNYIVHTSWFLSLSYKWSKDWCGFLPSSRIIVEKALELIWKDQV